MYIVIGLGLVLLIIAVICVIIIVSVYNTLIHLQKTAENTLQTIFNGWNKKSDTLNDEVKEHIVHCINAKTVESQVKSFNKLVLYSQSISLDNALGKKIKAIDMGLSTEKRFYTNTARELNDRLVTFPSSIIASMIGIKQLPLIELNAEESKGIIPEAKYL